MDVTGLEKIRRAMIASAPHLVKETGEIVTFRSESPVALNSLSVTMQPEQAGTGEPSPENVRPITGWTGAKVTRTGKNLLEKPFIFRPVPSALSDCFFIKAGTYTFSFDSIGTATSWRYGVSMFDADGNELSDNVYKPNQNMNYIASVKMWYLGADINTKTLTVTYIKDCYTRIWFGSGNTTSEMTATNAQLELGSTATPYSPYTGETVDVQFPAMGANQWDEEWELGIYSNDDGTPVANNSRIRSKNPIYVKPSTEYYVYCGDNSIGIVVHFYNSAGVQIESNAYKNVVLTTPQNTAYIKFNTNTADITTYGNNISINYPSTATSYEPYTNTVYGGTLDVATGELVVDRAEVDLGNLNWYSAQTSESGIYRNGTNSLVSTIKMPATSGTLTQIKCSCYPTITGDETYLKNIGIGLAKNGNLFVYDPNYNDSSVTAFVESVTGQKIVYELATPLTYTLTPQEIATLTGTNTIWSDAGDVTIQLYQVP